MPIRIFTKDLHNKEIAWLCDSEWSLRPQIETLTLWLEESITKLAPGEYVADVGFCWRKDASGGGPALSPHTLALMAKANIYLYLSEYPGFCAEPADGLV